jgi:3-hydroxybutyryl-CoA dehydrogenase
MINNVTICGAGTMGRGIAQVAAQYGYSVRLFDLSQDQLDAAMKAITGNLAKGVARGKTSEAERAQCLQNLGTHTDLKEACFDCDLFIEAVPEQLSLKHRIFCEVEEYVSAVCILGTNTSSLSISDVAKPLTHPNRVIGTHFFNPVHIMKLLELVFHEGTEQRVIEAVQEFGVRIKKECILVRNAPGFATSRLGVALGMEAIRMFEEGVASAADIDKAMVLGYRHPIGPLKLTDLVGLDVRMDIGNYLSKALSNPAFNPPELMKKMVQEGHLGKKSGKGFYDYES